MQVSSIHASGTGETQKLQALETSADPPVRSVLSYAARRDSKEGSHRVGYHSAAHEVFFWRCRYVHFALGCTARLQLLARKPAAGSWQHHARECGSWESSRSRASLAPGPLQSRITTTTCCLQARAAPSLRVLAALDTSCDPDLAGARSLMLHCCRGQCPADPHSSGRR